MCGSVSYIPGTLPWSQSINPFDQVLRFGFHCNPIWPRAFFSLINSVSSNKQWQLISSIWYRRWLKAIERVRDDMRTIPAIVFLNNQFSSNRWYRQQLRRLLSTVGNGKETEQILAHTFSHAFNYIHVLPDIIAVVQTNLTLCYWKKYQANHLF